MLCSNTDEVRMAYSACAATSSWTEHVDRGLFFQPKKIEKKDDIEIWLLMACRKCLEKGYKKFLDIERKKAIRFLFVRPFGVLGIFLVSLF